MNFSEFNPAWLAAGGIFALVAGFWNHVRAALRSISKVVIFRAHLDYPTSLDCARLLRVQYKTWSWSDTRFYSKNRSFIDEHLSRWVPFETPPESGLYKGPRGWAWVSSPNNRMEIAVIKGTFDFRGFINDALDFDLKSKTGIKHDRFYIERVIGSEKGSWALGAAIKERSGSDSPRPETSGSSSGKTDRALDESPLLSLVHEDIDVSFKYAKNLYTRTGDVDPFKGLFYTKEVMDQVQGAQQWLANGKWYSDRDIPWRKGLMIHGPGGTGKSSLAKAQAQSLGIPLVHFFLNTLSDQEFIKHWNQLPVPCVVLLEDIDNVFHLRVPQTEHKSLSFDCLLNMISGVSSVDGVFLIVTTNDISKVDPALGVAMDGDRGISTRPGRIDQVIYLGAAPEEQRQQIVKHILRDWPEEVNRIVAETDNLTPAQVQEVCRQIAYQKLGR